MLNATDALAGQGTSFLKKPQDCYFSKWQLSKPQWYNYGVIELEK
jgi:hypothetical protein